MIQLLVAYYNNAGEARLALGRLNNANIATVDTVILTKDDFGNTSVEDLADPDTGEGGLFGAVIGGLLGLLAGPLGGAVGVAAGAMTGGLAAGAIDTGIDNEYLHVITERMENNTSALITMIRAHNLEEAHTALDAAQAQIVRYNVKLDLDEAESM